MRRLAVLVFLRKPSEKSWRNDISEEFFPLKEQRFHVIHVFVPLGKSRIRPVPLCDQSRRDLQQRSDNDDGRTEEWTQDEKRGEERRNDALFFLHATTTLYLRSDWKGGEGLLRAARETPVQLRHRSGPLVGGWPYLSRTDQTPRDCPEV